MSHGLRKVSFTLKSGKPVFRPVQLTNKHAQRQVGGPRAQLDSSEWKNGV